MRRGAALVAGLALCGMWCAGAMGGEAAAVACTPTTEYFLSRRSDEAVLAVATDEWWETAHVGLPLFEGRDLRMESSGAEPFRAQRFVSVLTGEGAAHGLDPGRTFLVFPLTHGPSCRLGPVRTREWVHSGDTVTFLLRPENRGLSSEGEPMFPQWTLRGPHPGSDQARSFLRREQNRRQLTGREFFEFIHALPSIAALREDRPAAVSAFEAWVLEHSDSTAYPVAESLRMLRH